MIALSPRLDDGIGSLIVRNEFHQTVRVKQFRIWRAAGPDLDLLEEPLWVAPGEEAVINITPALTQLFAPNTRGQQERCVVIHPNLEPEPAQQPPPGTYLVGFLEGHLVGFSLVAGDN